MLRQLLISTGVVALLIPIPLEAVERVLTFDPARTTVEFTLGATLHTVHGRFNLVRGAVRFDAVPGPASGEVVVDATSGDTDNESRDKKMHAEVLSSSRYPQILLVPSRVQGQVPAAGKGAFTVEGVIRLLGVDHPVTIPVEVEASGEAVHATATFTVPFVAWGVPDPSVFVLRVDKEVTVEVDAHATLSAAPTPASAPAGAPR